jgi:hypothetical protein
MMLGGSVSEGTNKELQRSGYLNKCDRPGFSLGPGLWFHFFHVAFMQVR